MAGLFDSLFGNSDPYSDGPGSGTLFGGEIGNALQRAGMAFLDPAGLPQIMAAQQKQRETAMAQQAMAEVIKQQNPNIDPKTLSMLVRNPAAAQMWLDFARRREGEAFGAAADRASPPMPGAEPTAAPVTVAPPPQANVPSLSPPSLATPRLQANPSPDLPDSLLSPSSVVGTRLTPPVNNLPKIADSSGATPIPGAPSEPIASAQQFQPVSKPELALAVRAQNSSPPPPNANQSAAAQLKAAQDYRNHWANIESVAIDRQYPGLAAKAKANLALADKWLAPDANPALQGNITKQKEIAQLEVKNSPESRDLIAYEKSRPSAEDLVKAEQKARALGTLSTQVGGLAKNYLDLDQLGGIVNTDKSAAHNVAARLGSTVVGQEYGQTIGSKAASIRQEIIATRPALINAIRQATSMGARGLDSNVELDFYLQQATNPQKDLWSNLAALDKLDKAYGLGTSLKTRLTPEQYARVEKGSAALETEFNTLSSPKKSEPSAGGSVVIQNGWRYDKATGRPLGPVK